MYDYGTVHPPCRRWTPSTRLSRVRHHQRWAAPLLTGGIRDHAACSEASRRLDRRALTNQFGTVRYDTIRYWATSMLMRSMLVYSTVHIAVSSAAPLP